MNVERSPTRGFCPHFKLVKIVSRFELIIHKCAKIYHALVMLFAFVNCSERKPRAGLDFGAWQSAVVTVGAK